jgi:predicted dehydrogenase
MQKYKWGIIGAGWIAGQFAEDLALLPNAELGAIASRSPERAGEFAEKHRIPKAYGSWEEMAGDDSIDIVYVATYHPFHFENTLACLEQGKAVLCEKPFTMNRGELEILADTARSGKVFLMEAIWTRFLPSTMKVMEIMSNGELGDLQSVYADFGFRLEFDPGHRLYDPAKGGGALLDIGIYPVFISLLTAGRPDRIQAHARFAATGTDHSCSMIFEQAGNVVSSLNCTLTAESPVEANLLFEKGRIRMDPWFLTPGPVTLFSGEGEPEHIEFPEPGHGYHYEASEVMRCMDQGLTESPLLPLDFSLELMETLDRVRKICGIHYPQDDKYGQ